MPKGVIVLLVVIGVVFLLTLAVGGANHDESYDEDNPPGFVKAIDNLGASRPLRIENDVTTSCTVQSATVVSVSGACAIEVPSRGAFSRPVKAVLRSASGTVGVTFRPAEGDAPPSKAIASGGCVSTGIDRHGGQLELACAGGGTCVVDLRPESC
jgi:hypothetical protein